jgi:hypothetical protein
VFRFRTLGRLALEREQPADAYVQMLLLHHPDALLPD